MTRMLRRVTGGNVIPSLKEEDDVTSDEEVASKPTNRFKMLLAHTDSDPEDEKSADEENIKPVTKGVKKKSRKSKRKPPKIESADDTNDEFDKTLEEFRKSYEDVQPSTSGANLTDGNMGQFSINSDVLKLKLAHLNEKHEVKKKFGFEIPSTWTGHDVARYKQSKFIAEVLPYWPQLAQTSGLSMKLVETKNGFAHFVFEHSKSYQTATYQVIESLLQGNVEIAVGLYSTLPYHIDLIMQVAEIAKQSEEMEKCLQLVERAVYILEKALHINFSSNLIKATCRLDYRYQVNRSFYRVMFQHIILLTSRASHRTALECAKMLFSLDPHDPYAIVLIIDSLALKCKEYEWLLRFIDCWTSVGQRKTMSLPNLLYSKALAEYHLAKKDVHALKKADDSLKDAIAKYPELVPLLAKEIPALGKKLPSNIISHPAFNSRDVSACVLSQYYPMYVRYASSQWERDEVVLDWLALCIQSLLCDANVHHTHNWAQYKEFRKIIFPSTPLSAKRHIFIGNLEGIPLLMNSHVQSSILSWDPFPPKDSIDKYAVTAPQPGNRLSSLTTSMINAIFRSLDPSFDVVE